MANANAASRPRHRMRPSIDAAIQVSRCSRSACHKAKSRLSSAGIDAAAIVRSAAAVSRRSEFETTASNRARGSEFVTNPVTMSRSASASATVRPDQLRDRHMLRNAGRIVGSIAKPSPSESDSPADRFSDVSSGRPAAATANRPSSGDGAPRASRIHNSSSARVATRLSSSPGSSRHVVTASITPSASASPRRQSDSRANWRTANAGLSSIVTSSSTDASPKSGQRSKGRSGNVTRHTRPCSRSRRGSRKSTSPCWMIGLYQSAT